MAAVIYCESCDAQQPNDWKSGDLCHQCGGTVREEVRCAWCAQNTPKGKFCKHCGNEVQSDRNFGPARILKSLGVDQLALTQKLSELEDSKREQYRNQFNQHYAFIELARQDLQRLENHVVIKGQEKFTALENELLPEIPFDKAYLDRCKAYAKLDAAQNEMDFLSRRKSFTSEVNKALAKIAYVRQVPFPTALDKSTASQYIRNGLTQEASLFKQESLLFFSHINSFLPVFDWQTIKDTAEVLKPEGKDFISYCIELANPLLKINYIRPYAALAVAHLLQQLEAKRHPEFERFKLVAEEALSHDDNTLRLAAAILFEQADRVLTVTHQDSPVSAIAIAWLIDHAPHKLPKIVRNNKLSAHQLDVLEEEIQKHPLVLPEALKAPFEQLAQYALNNLLEAEGFRASANHNASGKAFYYRIIAFAGQFGKITQEQLDKLVQNSQSSGYFDAAEAILSYVSANNLDLQKVNALWFDRPKEFEIYETGFAFLEKALAMVQNGNYPSEQSLSKILMFLKLHFSKISISDSVNRTLMLNFFNEIAFAQHPVSYTFAKFLIRELFDLTNYSTTDWLLFVTCTSGYLKGQYYVGNSREPRDFALTDTFIEDFFDGSWEKFAASYNQVMTFRCKMDANYEYNDIIEPWIEPVKEEVAQTLMEKPAITHSLLEGHKEAILFGLPGIFQIETHDNKFPFIEALGNKEKWDTGDVILYAHRPNVLHYNQSEKCLNHFHEWLTRNNFRNYYSPIFAKYGRDFFNFSVKSEQVPFGMIKTWLQMAAVRNKNEQIAAFFNDRFGCLVPYSASNPMVSVLKDGESFALTGAYVITHLFKDFEEVIAYAQHNFPYGLNHKTNAFLLHALQDLGTEIQEHLTNQEQITSLVNSLFLMAKNTENNEHSREFWLSAVLNVLLQIAPVVEDRNFIIERVWQMADLHFTLTEKVYDFVKAQVSNMLQHNPVYGIKFLYAYLEDYYFRKYSAPWVADVMKENIEDIAKGFSQDSTLMAEKINHLIAFSNKEPYDSDQKRIQKEFEKHVIAILDHMPKEDISDDIWLDLQYKIHLDEINFFFKTDLERWMEANGISLELEEAETFVVASEDSVSMPGSSMEIPDNIDYDPDEIYMDMMEISTFMGSFTVNTEQMEKLINHIPYYKKDKSNNPMLLSVLSMKQTEIRTFLAEDMGTAINLYQKLFEVLIDPLCAPDGPFSTYGLLAALQMQQLLDGSIFAMQYISSVETMLNTGAYSAAHTQMLQNLLDQLKAAS
ncbi:hypothetical protein GCM10011506_06610 [Marivirga lumbricoides]|uniref:DZANK-type domain-containing protein n=1 Tax=Marivirga lumbricoides TaxID=1046115 RepID=A0ABQ1LFC0_9BACT|nr:hypothetical protein GCM10011506_06610 [Marivirga lumbricoides]